MKTITLIITLMAVSMLSFSQIIELKFTALNNGVHVNIDSVRVTNLTHCWR